MKRKIKRSKQRQNIKAIINAPLPAWTKNHSQVQWLAEISLWYKARLLRGNYWKRALIGEAEFYCNDREKRMLDCSNITLGDLGFRVWHKRFWLDQQQERIARERRVNESKDPEV